MKLFCSRKLEYPRFLSFRLWPLHWNRKLRNICKTCKFQRVCFIWGSWKLRRFPSFRFWSLYWNWKLRKFVNTFKTCKFQRTFLFEEVGNFQSFRVFNFCPFFFKKNTTTTNNKKQTNKQLQQQQNKKKIKQN